MSGVSQQSRPYVLASSDDAVAGVAEGATVLVSGWGGIGVPEELILSLARTAPGGLTIVSNNCGMGRPGDVGELFAAGLVSKAISTFPVSAGATAFRERLDAGELELEVVPQGTLAERLRAAGAGLGGFFTPTGAGTLLAEGKEVRVINGREQIFEQPLFGDLAVVRAHQADTMGNLRFRYAGRGFGPLMAMAARLTVVQVDEIVPAGQIAPDDVHLPGIFVDRIVVAGGAGE